MSKIEETLFLIEPVSDQKKTEEETLDSTFFDEMNTNESQFVKKSDNIRIRSKKFNSYLAVRQFRNENKAMLLLTKNLSDLTIFKLKFLIEEDKVELNFFEQVNLSLEFLFDYFEKLSIERDEINKNEQNDYIKIIHIFHKIKK